MKEKIKTYYIDLVKGRRKGAQDALFSFFLSVASYIYQFFVSLILFAYQKNLLRIYKPDCRVISVGNITWGGTGKTPFTETLARFLQEAGKETAILMRGYGQDEFYMLKKKLPDTLILAGRDRIKTAKIAAERYKVNAIILDDGFQHWRLGRDLDIVLIDASCPFGNKRLIPWGILREPLTSLKRADMFVLTKTDLAQGSLEPIKQELRKFNCRASIYEAQHRASFLRSLTSSDRIELSAIRGRRVGLVCAIASEESLVSSLEPLGAKIALTFYFPDHYQYKQEDVKKIERQCLESQVTTIVTTEKDATKLTALLKSSRVSVEILALCIEFKIIRDEEEFWRCLKNDRALTGIYSILILSDGKPGHLNQSKSVARIIQDRKISAQRKEVQTSIKIVEVKFKSKFSRIVLAFCSILTHSSRHKYFSWLRFYLTRESFKELMHTSANIIVSAGSSLSAVSLPLADKNNARNIILMKPSFLSPERFDLVIAPEHDRIKSLSLKKSFPAGRPKNILLTKIAPNLVDQQYLQEQAEVLQRRLQASGFRSQAKGPTIGVLLGGDTAAYRLTTKIASKIISQLKEAVLNLNCQILITTSRRTPRSVEQLLKEELEDLAQCRLLVIANEKNIPEVVGGILGLSDIIIVSGESISMVSEAVSAGKYILVFNLEKRLGFRARLCPAPRFNLTKQDRFLARLEQEGFLKIVPLDNLVSEITKTWQAKPIIKKLQDREAIYQAVGRLI